MIVPLSVAAATTTSSDLAPTRHTLTGCSELLRTSLAFVIVIVVAVMRPVASTLPRKAALGRGRRQRAPPSHACTTRRASTSNGFVVIIIDDDDDDAVSLLRRVAPVGCHTSQRTTLDEATAASGGRSQRRRCDSRVSQSLINHQNSIKNARPVSKAHNCTTSDSLQLCTACNDNSTGHHCQH